MSEPALTERETRLRRRIDQVTDERDFYRAQLVALLAPLLDAAAYAKLKNQSKYKSEAERAMARRRQWRESKRRAAERKKAAAC